MPQMTAEQELIHREIRPYLHSMNEEIRKLKQEVKQLKLQVKNYKRANEK